MNEPTVVTKKRQPAYAKEVRRALEDGLMPPRALYVTRIWPKGDPPLWTIIVGRHDDPSDYDLSVCRGLSVWVKLPRLLARDNAALIRLIEEAGCEGGVVTVDGVAGCAFINGTAARARNRQ